MKYASMAIAHQRPVQLALLLAIAAAWPAASRAAPGADSPYRTDAQSSHVEDATSKGVNQVNMITCIMSALRPDALVNQGNYNALVDENKCDPDARSSTSNAGSSSSGAQAPSMMTAVVNSTRTSNADPMRVKTWLDMAGGDGGFNPTIHINISASEAPSSSNPYGVFRLDYCGKGPAGCMMKGFLQGNAGGITYFETESQNGGGGGPSTKALRMSVANADSGAGSLMLNDGGQQVAFNFAYNADYFRRSDGTNDQCFARDASDTDTQMSVWRYGLYDAGSGARITRNSGFPIEYTALNGTTYHGNMGYWGLWLPPEVAGSVGNGATVQRVEYNNGQAPTKTAYTLLKADGRLTKYTKRTRTLTSIDKIHFNAFIGDATGFFVGAQGWRQYEMYWDNAAGVFKATGVMNCDNNGCQTGDLVGGEQVVAASYFSNQGGVRGWSQSLGGDVFIPLTGGTIVADSITVVYREQSLVYPAEMPTALNCLRDCPTAASMGAYFAQGSSASSPFTSTSFNNWGPTPAGNVVGYTMDSTLALLRDGASAAVTFTDAQALQSRPQYQSGVRSGRLFADLSAAVCDNDATQYCPNKVDELEVYYQWETGPNQWNQFAAVKDGTGAVVNFDAPLQVSYDVPAGSAYGAYAGKSIVLQYGGFGELWGIPGVCVSPLNNDRVSCDTPNSRYVPSFVIPVDEVLGRVQSGGTPLLAKWLDREIRFARKDVSVCTFAGVTLNVGVTLPTVADLQDPTDSASAIYIGDKPVVTDAPRVIHGDVKY